MMLCGVGHIVVVCIIVYPFEGDPTSFRVDHHDVGSWKQGSGSASLQPARNDKTMMSHKALEFAAESVSCIKLTSMILEA